MNIASKTLKNGFSMPSIGKGTWMTNIGRKPRPSLQDDTRISEIKQAIDNGITYIDTAQRYSNGYGETIIGKAIKGYACEKLFLVTKVSSNNLSYTDVIACAKSSIKKLQSSYVDLYLIHQYNSDISLQETMKAMDHLIEQKLIKYIGVCNFTKEQIEEAQSFTKNPIVANQLHYNILFRKPEESEIIDYCQKKDIMIIAWRPYELSLLTPKTTTLLTRMAEKYKTTSSQIALHWLIAQKNVVALAKFTTKNAIQETNDGRTVTISPSDLQILTTESK